MKVSVRFFAALRELVGKKIDYVELHGRQEYTVEEVIQHLCKHYGKGFVEYVIDRKSGDLKGYLTLLVNGRSINALDGLRTKLADGDVLALLPPVAGG